MSVDLFQFPQLTKELQHDSSGEIHFRSLQITDLEKGFLPLLSQLTAAPDVDKETFVEAFNKMRQRSVQHQAFKQLELNTYLWLLF
jgi:hypothetical protein